MKFTFEEFEIEEIQGLGVQEKDAMKKYSRKLLKSIVEQIRSL